MRYGLLNSVASEVVGVVHYLCSVVAFELQDELHIVAEVIFA